MLEFGAKDYSSFVFQKVQSNQIVQTQNLNDIVLIMEGSFRSSEKNQVYEPGQVFSNVFKKQADKEMQRLISSKDSLIAVLGYEDYMKIVKQSPMFPVQDECDSQIESSEYDGLKNISMEDIEVIDHLGYGNFSVCLLVQIKKTQYALKYIHKYYIQQFEMNEQMIQEKDVFKRMKGNFFAKLYKTMQDEDYAIMLMQYIKGNTIEQLIHQEGPISQQNIGLVIKQMVLGLNNMHSQKIVHRDIKLQNFMISSNYQVKYIDFGFSKVLNMDSNVIIIKY